MLNAELTIQDFPNLRAPHVRMKDEAAVLRTINAMAKGGTNKLQVVTDFDRTVTKQHVDGKPILSSFCIFEQSPMVPESLKEKANKYTNIYRPIEIDTKLPMDVRESAMTEWMVVTEQIYMGLSMPQKEIRRLAQRYGTDLRDHTKEMFEHLNKNGVPILVFSAGLGDIVEAILKNHDIFLKHVKVISNFLNFDGDKILGFKNNKHIHVFNKQEHAIEGDENYKFLKNRSNIILMGDTTGDSHMADGLEHVESVLKIGFLYDDAEKNLASFMDKFDIVLIDDQTMDIPYSIMKSIL